MHSNKLALQNALRASGQYYIAEWGDIIPLQHIYKISSVTDDDRRAGYQNPRDELDRAYNKWLKDLPEGSMKVTVGGGERRFQKEVVLHAKAVPGLIESLNALGRPAMNQAHAHSVPDELHMTELQPPIVVSSTNPQKMQPDSSIGFGEK